MSKNITSYVLGPPTIIDVDELRPGDILLHYGKWWKVVPFFVRRFTGSPYTHASIYLGNGEIAEATPPKVRKSLVANAIKESRHLAVFRSQMGFGKERNECLLNFVEEVINNKARYDFPGAWQVRNNKAFLSHQENAYEKLDAFFSTNPTPRNQVRNAYFCSAFVARCYCQVGIIHPSAEVLFKPTMYSPKGLSEEPTFGHVFGYLTKHGCAIPRNDPFLKRSSYKQIFN